MQASRRGIRSGRGESVIAGVLVLVLAACGGKPVAPVTPGKPGLALSPAALDFGLLVPGTAKTLELTVTNDGTAALVVAGHALDHDARGAFVVDGVPAELAPGAKAIVQITYRAAAAETSDAATLGLTSNAANLPAATIPLTGRTAPASCADGRKDGSESAVDCGGSACPGCASGATCASAGDCGATLACVGNVCGACAAAGECRTGEICAGGLCGACHGDAECADGSTCDAGACRPCAGASGKIDTRTDARNCGGCGIVCAAPAHAAASCAVGACGRGPCEAGFFDLDGATTFGCEATCAGHVCHGPAGDTHVDNVPLAEHDLGLRTFSSGSSWGGAVQTSPRFTNLGVLGESTPPPVELRSTRFIFRGGVHATQR